MDLNWYKFAMGKEDISSLIPNKYVEAQAAKAIEKVKYPYWISVIRHDEPRPIAGIAERKWAFSKSQARFLFFKDYPKLKDYVKSGFEVEVVLDNELWEKTQREKAEAVVNETQKKQKRDEYIQTMWWNKD